MSLPPQSAARIAALERENEQLRGAIELLHRIANLVRAALAIEPTFYSVLTSVTAGVGLGFNRALLFVPDARSRRTLRGAAAVGPDDAEEANRVWKRIVADGPDLEMLYKAGMSEHMRRGRLDAHVRSLSLSVDGGTPIALAMRSAKMVVRGGTDDLGGLLHLPTSIAAPLRGRTAIHGVLYADNRFTQKPIDPISELVFNAVADHAGHAIDNAAVFEKLAGEARTDALTGLGHHGSLMNDLDHAVATARLDAQPLALAMIDLDGFKRVNDTWGHLAGDAFLVGVASRLRAVMRGAETLYRYGGDEFAVVLPNADGAAAAAVGERLREALASRPIRIDDDNELGVTCSVGVASLPTDATDSNSLVAAADAALFRAKRSGKNVVMNASSSV